MRRFGAAWLNWRYLGAVLSLALFGVALLILRQSLADVQLADVMARFRGTPARSLFLAGLCTFGSYITLTGYDVIALRYLGRPLPYPRTVLASFASYAFGHNIGLSLVTGGSIRYRIYSVVGLSGTEIATLTALCGLTFGLGVGLLLGSALVLEPSILGPIDRMSAALNRTIGIVILLVVLAYAVWTAMRRRPLQIGNWSFRPPGLRTTLGQLALGGADISLAAGALYLLLPGSAQIDVVPFLGIYVAAMTISVLSHAPGGLGVFEAMILLAMPEVGQAALLGSLLVYRCLYYLLPFAVAAVLLAAHEYQLRRAVIRPAIGPAIQTARGLAHAIAPQVIGAAVFISGAILLFSAATPALEGRLAFLRHILPLPFIEASHLLSSVVGLWLMILARGLFRRLDGAFQLAVAVLCGGIVFSVLKGADFEEALILCAVLALLLASRSAFYRKASLLSQPFSTGWVATLAAMIGGSIWLGMFAFKHVEYSESLWWQFAYHGDASRFLRASVVVTVLAVSFLILTVLRPASSRAVQDNPDPETIKAIVARSPHTDANLALTGDKRFLMSDNADAFIMYQVQGRSWVALGDPVGPPDAWGILLWRFRELCDRYNGWPAFYQVAADDLPLYLDLGLSLLKLGEEARIDLEVFSLEGSARRELRYAVRRAAKEGAVFDLVPAADVPGILPELRSVSDAWLKGKSAYEKGFSVGQFNDDYLKNFDCALVRRGGDIVAFANVWRAPEGEELSIDLMRHRRDVPYGIMDFLFVQLMLLGKEEGYRWFSLGMAPLSGLENHQLGPVWNRIGAFAFRHGEHFYNFEGLRSYKEKFGPIWEPKYLATPGGFVLPRTLLDIVSLISGGVRQTLRG